MKIYKVKPLLFFLLLIFSCENNVGPNREGTAEVAISVASRGGYQFLIEFDGDLYFPENLPEEFRVVSQEPIPVNIKFQILDNKEDIFQPAPNDVPIILMSVPVINILSIEKIKSIS
ncbi:MAG: hypothetical protein GYB55_00355 [Cytophagales bacterium]|uniref:hypothetical protein n=1 Tax=Cyclobacterium marinum TaxID=104 RepID=UPI0030DDB8CC|nr:hypothetical protein [Cytophagales bacterium]|tara:strand:- start:4146 stop:4496 length:351 start_codon:yes stop_codon:yes gene_type:complete